MSLEAIPVGNLILTIALILVPCSALLTFLNRKFAADLQARVGPNRAGPAGIFQPIADLLKMLQKQETGSAGMQEVFLLLQAALLFSTIAILPLGSAFLLLDADMSVFLAFWAGLAVALIALFIGFQKGNMPGWLGGIRIAMQTVTGAFPALVAVLCVGVRTGGFRWTQILSAQDASPLSWAVFSSPFAPLAFLVFIIAGLILFDAAPLDSAASRSELTGGASSIWSGRNLVLANFMRFYGFFLWTSMAVALFLGGWLLPHSVQDLIPSGTLGSALEVLVFLSKTFLLMLVIGWISRVNPRTRADQITSFSWRVLSPVAIFALIGSSIWKVWLS